MSKLGRIIVENAIERKPGYLYYIDSAGNLCEAKLNRGGKPKGTKDKRHRKR